MLVIWTDQMSILSGNLYRASPWELTPSRFAIGETSRYRCSLPWTMDVGGEAMLWIYTNRRFARTWTVNRRSTMFRFAFLIVIDAFELALSIRPLAFPERRLLAIKGVSVSAPLLPLPSLFLTQSVAKCKSLHHMRVR